MAGGIEWATTWLSRLKGLLGRSPSDVLLVLCPCSNIHTWGMRHCLDVAFVGKDGAVLKVLRGMEPRERECHPRAVMVVERFASNGAWFAEGEFVDLISRGKEVLP